MWLVFFLVLLPPPTATLFPYTTLFRSVLRFHRVLLVASALCAALLVLLADVLLRWLFNSADAVEVPTGVITTALGAIFLIIDRKSTRLNSSHVEISYAVFCLKKKKPPT